MATELVSISKAEFDEFKNLKSTDFIGPIPQDTYKALRFHKTLNTDKTIKSIWVVIGANGKAQNYAIRLADIPSKTLLKKVGENIELDKTATLNLSREGSTVSITGKAQDKAIEAPVEEEV